MKVMKKRMGASPLDVLTRSTAPAASRPAAKAEDPREKEIRAGMKVGRFHNYYAKADGSLVQRLPVYLDAAEVVRLKVKAAQERRTVSELIRRAVAVFLAEK